LPEGRNTDLEAAIAALWADARDRALQRVDVVEGAVRALASGSLDAAAAEEATREAHKLAGALGTFGMPAGTAHARAIERALAGRATPADAPALAEAAAALRAVVAAGPDASRTHGSRPAGSGPAGSG
jgi:HPt (histidine-containing phosphotransfer) domain-containing protein